MSGAVPPPAARPWGRAWHPGSVAGVSRVRVVWAPLRALCELALRTVGVVGGRPRGGCLAPF